MDRKFWPVTLLLFIVGCGQTSQPEANVANNRVSSGSSANGFAADTPDRAVFDFLEAVRTGNDQQASTMLTPLARQKTTEMQMVVAPPGSPTAQFKVGQVEYVTPNKDGAHVWCNWTDQVDAEGHTRTDNIIWVLRREDEGWRIAGMVTKVFPDQPPLVLNFEDPEDMLRKQQLLHDSTSGGSENQQTGQPQAERPAMAAPVAR
ncbi:MAG TPA: hypothetical protein VFE46_16110 [Pirellulales bacterium]|jgi:hypothetical protein|nr:hypothetical protein [Pirellulales bacterium]